MGTSIDWLHVAISGLAGGLSVWTARRLVGEDVWRFRFILAVGIAFVVFRVTLVWLLQPIESWEVQHDLDAMPLYRELLQDEPDAVREIAARVQAAARSGEGYPRLRARAEAMVGQLGAGALARNAGRASDASMISFQQTVGRVLDRLHDQSTDECYFFLFPMASGAQPVVLDQPTAQALMAANAEVLRTAREQPQPPPTQVEVAPLLRQVVTTLRGSHGDEANVLFNIQAPGVDHRTACEMTIAFYREILELPAGNAGRVLRWAISHGQGQPATTS